MSAHPVGMSLLRQKICRKIKQLFKFLAVPTTTPTIPPTEENTMAVIVDNGVKILDADLALPTDDTLAYAVLKADGNRLSLKVASIADAGTNVPALMDEDATKKLLQAINDRAAAVFPSWSVGISGL